MPKRAATQRDEYRLYGLPPAQTATNQQRSAVARRQHPCHTMRIRTLNAPFLPVIILSFGWGEVNSFFRTGDWRKIALMRWMVRLCISLRVPISWHCHRSALCFTLDRHYLLLAKSALSHRLSFYSNVGLNIYSTAGFGLRQEFALAASGRKRSDKFRDISDAQGVRIERLVWFVSRNPYLSETPSSIRRKTPDR